MTYNSSNLIEKIERGGKILAKYSYLADGEKLTASDADGSGFHYLGSLVYRTQNGRAELESTDFGGGRLVAASGGMEPRYFLTDHLGSVRQIVDSDGSVVEQNDYYPFGKRWPSAAAPVSDNRHRFSGKEEQAFLSLPYVDFGLRMYNPDWGRWFTQDPLLEKYFRIGQYNYCAGNPVKYIDQDGKQPQTAFKSPDVAAKNWGQYYNGKSILIGREMSSSIYVLTNDRNVSYAYSEPTIGKNAGVIPSPAPNGETVVATIHSHGKYEKGYLNNDFSEVDKDNAKYRSVNNYVATPNGSLKKYDQKTGNITILSTDLPSDPADPDRKNNQDPIDIPTKIKREEAKRFVETLQREEIIPTYSTLEISN